MEKASLRVLEQVHRKHEAAIRAFVRSRVRDDEDAIDLTLVVFVSAYQAWETYEADLSGSVPVLEWLFTIADKICLLYAKNHPPRFGMN